MNKEKNSNEDRNVDLVLRPTNWSEYVGQEKVKKNLKMIMEAAKKEARFAITCCFMVRRV